MNRAELKSKAKEQIKGKIGILFVILLITIALSYLTSLLALVPLFGGIVSTFLVTAPLSLGEAFVYLKVSHYKNVSVKDLFEGYNDLWSIIKVQFFSLLFIGLWSLLFIIPGIIKGFSYSMAYYILAENKGMGALEAIRRSKEMMNGHKMEFFVLSLSFIGWYLLVAVTFGIASIWVIPYVSTTMANFYNEIKGTEITIDAETVIVD